MTGTSRIVSIDPSASDAAADAPQPPAFAQAPFEGVDEIDVEADRPAPARWPGRIAAGLGIVAVGGWTALFALANPGLIRGGTPGEWTGWIRDWSIPVILIGIAWLLAMRNSRREATRFGDAARLLRTESAQLEARLTGMNREISLAREFLASQTRDLDSLGRIATERLSQNADRLAELIRDNGSRLDTIGSVSSAALENMERLRGQLPVIASSAKDVTNNIGAAGRTAQAQLEDMVTGFNRLNQFGQASERQVTALRGLVEETLAGFARQAEQIETIAAQRFAALGARSQEFRTQLDGHEIEALAAIRNRATALADELQASRAALDEQEAQSLTSLRARLVAVRDESVNISRAVRDGEDAALETWGLAVRRLETDVAAAVARLAELDEHAIASARSRIAALADESAEVRDYMAERDQLFIQELEQRRVALEASQTEFTEVLAERMARLDALTNQRSAELELHARQMASASDAAAARLADIAHHLDAASRLGSEAEQRIAASLEALGAKLASSREALDGTDAAVARLTDDSVRLLELIQASARHSATDLPEAIGQGEGKLAELERRADNLRATVSAAEAAGAALTGHVDRGHQVLRRSMVDLDELQAELAARSASQAEAVDALRASLESVREETLAQAETAQSALARAIDELAEASRRAVSGIEGESAAALSALAARLGEESASAIDRAVRQRTAEVSGQLEQAAAHAAGVSREAAIQLRDQLAKVNELAGNLERRVAHARERAEEQVDNDFARRMALIADSLNSNAIDIAKVLSSEVSDTAWAAYLRGDRGIFTRRAVSLIDSGEARAISQVYESDGEFREHVSRYIHDFEGMLRQLLSTRDGHALGVTLLSSDMGKLYVALAQAIERLRS